MKLSHPIGVFGGTFDPIHAGHLAIAENLSTHIPLPNIQFIPCLQPPHREPPQANAEQRLDMVQLAIAGHSGWSANDIDLQRPGPSYMVDTLTLLRHQQPQTPWCLILGMDAFAELNHWREWERILKLAHLIVVNRPDFELPNEAWNQNLLAKSQVQSADYFFQHLSGGILLHEMPPSPISATAIRSELQLHHHTPVWLPPAVYEYIEQHGLYSKMQATD